MRFDYFGGSCIQLLTISFLFLAVSNGWCIEAFLSVFPYLSMLTEITGDTKGLAGKHELYIFPDLQFWLFTALEVSLVMFMSLDAPWFDQLPGYFITCNSMPTSSIGVPTGVTWSGAGFPSNNPVTTKTFLCITSTLLDSDCVQIAILSLTCGSGSGEV